MIPRLKRLLDHLEWADRRALEATTAADADGARRRLAHLLAAETVWLRRLETGDASGVEIWPELSLEECERRRRENVEGYRALLEGLSREDLDREVAYRNSTGREYRTPVADILLHVFLHGAYHRGQIALRVREAEGEPKNTDYITFVRGERGPGAGI